MTTSEYCQRCSNNFRALPKVAECCSAKLEILGGGLLASYLGLKSHVKCLLTHFSLLIPPSHPSLHQNPDTTVIFNKVILIKKKTYLYMMGSKCETITICKHALMMFLNTQSCFFLFAFNLFSKFEEFRFHFPYWHVQKLCMYLLFSFIPIFL